MFNDATIKVTREKTIPKYLRQEAQKLDHDLMYFLLND